MWIEIDEDYLMYLRDNGDPRVPQQNYGKNKFKPFFKLFSLGEIVYVTSVTSPKEKYKYFKEDLDFTKCLCQVKITPPLPLKKGPQNCQKELLSIARNFFCMF